MKPFTACILGMMAGSLVLIWTVAHAPKSNDPERMCVHNVFCVKH